MLNNPDNLENMVDDDVTVTNDEASFANLAGESLTSLVEIVPFTRDQVKIFYWRLLACTSDKANYGYVHFR